MLKRTALHDLHREREAKLAPFAGFDMPLHYPLGALKEHLLCRERAAVFDVSHMGQLAITCPSVAAGTILSELEKLISADLLSLPLGRQRYGLLLTPSGGILDDLIVMHMSDHIRLVVNAACAQKDVDYLETHFQDHLPVVITQLQRALVAVQGPMAETALSELIVGVADLSFMQVGSFSFNGHEVQISRSGYTGEDGFEVSLPDAAARMFVDAVCNTGKAELAGLVARDSLRLEAGLCLYGQDMNEDTSVTDVGLGWAVGRARRSGGEREGGFQGADRTLAEFKDGASWQRVGAQSRTNRPVRTGTQVFADELSTVTIGSVTSGSPAPSVGCPVVMMRLLATHEVSREDVVWADVRGRRIALTVCDMPFFAHRYKR
jgi:aminomethyltransferase